MNKENSTLRERTFTRLAQSIAGEKSDAHSVFNYYTFPFFQSLTGVDLNDYFHNPKTTLDTQLKVYEMLDKCGNFAPDTGPVAETNALGGEVYFDRKGFINVHTSGIEDIDDIKDLKPGDPYGDNYMRKGLECLEYLLANAPKGYKVNPPNMMGPFTVAAQLRGISDLCADTIMEPEFVKALLDICTETTINYINASEKTMGGTLHHILISDDLSSFLNPELYEEFVMPTYKAIFKEFPKTQFWLHNDAKATHIAHYIAEVGFAAWQYAPSMDVMETYNATKGKVSLLGGLSPVELQSLTEEETYQACIAKLKSFEGHNKFVLGVGGSVNQIPIENLMAMFRAADEFKI